MSTEAHLPGLDPITAEKLSLPSVLGVSVNVFEVLHRYVDVYLIPGSDVYEVDEYSGDEIIARYNDRFNHWEHALRQIPKISGFLAGFPVLIGDSEIPALHVWGNNADIISTSKAVGLTSISRLDLYSSIYTQLRVEMDELTAGGSMPRYQVPLLTRKPTADTQAITIYRDADQSDIQATIDRLAEVPITVFEDGTYHPDKPTHDRIFQSTAELKQFVKE
jgi:hypothetical protein